LKEVCFEKIGTETTSLRCRQPEAVGLGVISHPVAYASSGVLENPKQAAVQVKLSGDIGHGAPSPHNRVPPKIQGMWRTDSPVSIELRRRRNAPSSNRSMTESRSISVALSPMTKASDCCKSVMRYVSDSSWR